MKDEEGGRARGFPGSEWALGGGKGERPGEGERKKEMKVRVTCVKAENEWDAEMRMNERRECHGRMTQAQYTCTTTHLSKLRRHVL